MAARTSLRLPSLLLFVGVVVTFVAGLFHTDRSPANDHVAAFTDYANSTIWTVVHLGQFVGMAIFLAGLLALYAALRTDPGTPVWPSRFGAVAAVVALALYGVLQAVDGVALKQAVNAWMAAPEAEKTVRFAAAEAIRWLEWAVRSYQSFVLGTALLLFAAAIVGAARVPKAIGYLMAVSGLAYLAQGWIIGAEGFSANNTLPTLLGYLALLVWTVWLLIHAYRAETPTRLPATETPPL
jgi:hypothetical protein